jgi:hypothetical protein
MNFAITYFERFNFFLIVPCGPLAILLVAYFSTSSSTRCYGSTVTCILQPCVEQDNFNYTVFDF